MITTWTATPPPVADVAGDVINYTITVENTGNMTLTGVPVTDPNAEGAGDRARRRRLVTRRPLEVGETWSYTAAHTVTQAEIDSNCGGDGVLCNTATADRDETVPDSADVSVPVAQIPALSITKLFTTWTATPPLRWQMRPETWSTTRSRLRIPATGADGVTVTDTDRTRVTFVAARRGEQRWHTRRWRDLDVQRGATRSAGRP